MQDCNVLRCVPKEFEGYKNVAMANVEQKGPALQYVPKGPEGYKDVAAAAVE